MLLPQGTEGNGFVDVIKFGEYEPVEGSNILKIADYVDATVAGKPLPPGSITPVEVVARLGALADATAKAVEYLRASLAAPNGGDSDGGDGGGGGGGGGDGDGGGGGGGADGLEQRTTTMTTAAATTGVAVVVGAELDATLKDLSAFASLGRCANALTHSRTRIPRAAAYCSSSSCCCCCCCRRRRRRRRYYCCCCCCYCGGLAPPAA
eukprot:COSAG06_NODE_4414_length_4288_cov_33.741704_5_plen_208_part_00